MLGRQRLFRIAALRLLCGTATLVVQLRLRQSQLGDRFGDSDPIRQHQGILLELGRVPLTRRVALLRYSTHDSPAPPSLLA